MFKTRIESGDTLRLVLFPVFVAFSVLVFAVGLNEAYAETEYEYRDDGTLKLKTEYYDDGWERKLVTEYRKDGSVKTETHYQWSHRVDSNFRKISKIEYRDDGTLIKYSTYTLHKNVEYKQSTEKFNKDGLPIWKKSFSPEGDINSFTEYKYYKDGKLKKKIWEHATTEYKYYKDGKLKKVIENNEWHGKKVTEYNKDGVCIQLPLNYRHHQYMCPADILPDHDWLTSYFYHDDIGHLIDDVTLPDYDYGGSPVKSTWHNNDGYVWTFGKYWSNGMSKELTYNCSNNQGSPTCLDTSMHDESGKPLTSTTRTYDGTVRAITEWGPDGSRLVTNYELGTDRIKSISEIGADGRYQKTTYLYRNGEVSGWLDSSPKEYSTLHDKDGNVIRISSSYGSKIFKPHCPPDRISEHDRDNKPVCLPEPVQECSTDGVTEQDESGRITKTTWRNVDCGLLEYENRAYWSNGNISQIIRYDADDNMIQFTYHNDSGNIYASHEYEDGEKTKSTFYRTDGSIYRITEYDDSGNISKITEYRKDGSSYVVDPDN